MDHIDAHSAVSTSSSSSKYDTPDDNISEQRLLCDAKVIIWFSIEEQP